MGTKHPLLIATLLVVILTSSAFAGWTVTYLNPSGCQYSMVYGISGGQPVGAAKGSATGSQWHAGMWSGTAESWQDLNPSGSSYSEAYCISGAWMYGCKGTPYPHAAKWLTTGGCTDINPAGYYASIILAAAGGQQVGYACPPADMMTIHAGLWAGTAGSFVDLHPAEFTQSRALGTSGTQQVGFVYGPIIGLNTHACLWTGTGASCVDLNPSGWESSQACGASGGQQVGYADIHGGPHAGMWSGTALSWLDLHPSGYMFSKAYAVCGGKQVGHASSNAGMWSGTASSWVNLHNLLNGSYSYSAATCIDVVGNEIWIGGMLTNTAFVDLELGIPCQAVMWHYTPDAPVPEPSSVLVLGMALPGLIFALRRRSG